MPETYDFVLDAETGYFFFPKDNSVPVSTPVQQEPTVLPLLREEGK